jgi:hypothetical protein
MYELSKTQDNDHEVLVSHSILRKEVSGSMTTTSCRKGGKSREDQFQATERDQVKFITDEGENNC